MLVRIEVSADMSLRQEDPQLKSCHTSFSSRLLESLLGNGLNRTAAKAAFDVLTANNSWCRVCETVGVGRAEIRASLKKLHLSLLRLALLPLFTQQKVDIESSKRLHWWCSSFDLQMSQIGGRRSS